MDFKEFAHMIRKIAPALKDHEIGKIFLHFDEDNSGGITL